MEKKASDCNPLVRELQARQVLRQLKGQGCRVFPRGERLIVRPFPDASLSEELRSRVREYRDELLQLVRPPAARQILRDTIEELASLWPRDWSPAPTLQLLVAQAELDAASKAAETEWPRFEAACERWLTLWKAKIAAGPG